MARDLEQWYQKDGHQPGQEDAVEGPRSAYAHHRGAKLGYAQEIRQIGPYEGAY